MLLTLKIKNDAHIIAERSHQTQTYLALKDYTYQAGDVIELAITSFPAFVWIQVDEAIEPSLVYMTNATWEYPVILDDLLRLAYSPKIFTGKKHYLRAWLPTREELATRRNLARNAHDQKEYSQAYPHASANVETRNDSTFFARNAIDGVLANEDHGPYPYQSWGINQRKDAEITIDFGREVILDQLALVLRGDYPHDSYWTQVTVEFSGGQTLELATTNELDQQFFEMEPIQTTFVKLKDLIKNEDESPFPALTQIEAYGVEVTKD